MVHNGSILIHADPCTRVLEGGDLLFSICAALDSVEQLLPLLCTSRCLRATVLRPDHLTYSFGFREMRLHHRLWTCEKLKN